MSNQPWEGHAAEYALESALRAGARQEDVEAAFAVITGHPYSYLSYGARDILAEIEPDEEPDEGLDEKSEGEEYEDEE